MQEENIYFAKALSKIKVELAVKAAIKIMKPN